MSQDQNHVDPSRSSSTSPPKLSLLGRSALAYAERFGYAVHPLRPDGKEPITAHSFKDASVDPEQISAWWTQTPEANIGIATGAVSGISVLDQDVKNGAGGDVALAMLLKEHGEIFEAQVHQKTWSGGRQFFFRYDRRARQGVGCYGKGLDGRNDGGYVVAPPSLVNGVRYIWIVKPVEGQGVVLTMPAWLLDLGTAIAPTNRERRNPPGWADALMMAGVPEGQRDHEANRLIKHARETRKSEADCWARLTTFGSNCVPPFDPKTDRKIAEKIRKTYAREPVFDEPVPVPNLQITVESESESEQDQGGVRFTDHMHARWLKKLSVDEIRHGDEMGEKWYQAGSLSWSLNFKTAIVPYIQRVVQKFFDASRQRLDAMAERRAKLPDPTIIKKGSST